MPPNPESASPEQRVVATWISLLSQGAPANVPFPRRIWDNAIRAVANVSSQPSLRYHTRAAKDMRLINAERGTRKKEGTITLLPPGHPQQYIPLLEGEPPASLVPVYQDAESTTTKEPPQGEG